MSTPVKSGIAEGKEASVTSDVVIRRCTTTEEFKACGAAAEASVETSQILI